VNDLLLALVAYTTLISVPCVCAAYLAARRVAGWPWFLVWAIALASSLHIHVTTP